MAWNRSIDRPYLLRDATIAISDNGGNILVAKSVTNSKRIVSLVFQIEISDNNQLEEIIKDSKNIENVFEAARIFPGKKWYLKCINLPVSRLLIVMY